MVVAACSSSSTSEIQIKNGSRITVGTDVDRSGVDRAADVIRRRLEDAKVAARVAVTDGRVVVDLERSSQEQMMRARDLISRRALVELAVVDSGSEFMHRVFKHVVADPAAAAAGITVDVERWQTPQGPAATDLFLMARNRVEGREIKGYVAIDQYLRDLAVKDERFAVPADRRIVYEEFSSGEDIRSPRVWRSYYVERSARITNASIKTATVGANPETKQPIVLVDLSSEGTTAFGVLTAAIVGWKLATILDGTVSAAPMLNSAILAGRFWIVPQFGSAEELKQEAELLAIALRHGPLPGRFFEESVVELVDGVPQAAP